MARTNKKPPPYAIEGVDRALHLAAILQLEGAITVTDAAKRLGIAPSTAHRLLAMLVHRDFAVRGDRTYEVGPVLAPGSPAALGTVRLRGVALPHLAVLAQRLEETVHLALRSGTTVRFLASVDGPLPGSVGNRAGMSFPAHRTAVGLALLAMLTDADVAELYAGHEQVHVGGAPLMSMLQRVRRVGYAVNRGQSERGVTAVGVPVRSPSGMAQVALSVAMPSMRYAPANLEGVVATLRAAAVRLEHDLDPPPSEDTPDGRSGLTENYVTGQ